MYKLIIVEDEEIVRSGLKNGNDWLDMGFEVVGTASDGFEALELVERLNPDAVLTDIRMPDMDGIQLMKILRQRHPHVEIVVFSGFSDFEYARKAIHYGVYEYLTKPVDDSEFQRVFKSLYLKIRDRKRSSLGSGKERMGSHKIDNEKLKDIFLSSLFTKKLDSEFIEESARELEIRLNEDCYSISFLKS